jgi:hypothetical protein
MAEVIYRIVEHDGAWAYKAGNVFSETYPTHKQALAAARKAAEEQRSPGRAEVISYEDEDGEWHQEVAAGDDRPITRVTNQP